MKATLVLLLLVVLFGCNPSPDKSSAKSPLVDTVWVCDGPPGFLIEQLEFKSDQVIRYHSGNQTSFEPTYGDSEFILKGKRSTLSATFEIEENEQLAVLGESLSARGRLLRIREKGTDNVKECLQLRNVVSALQIHDFNCMVACRMVTVQWKLESSFESRCRTACGEDPQSSAWVKCVYAENIELCLGDSYAIWNIPDSMHTIQEELRVALKLPSY